MSYHSVYFVLKQCELIRANSSAPGLVNLISGRIPVPYVTVLYSGTRVSLSNSREGRVPGALVNSVSKEQ